MVDVLKIKTSLLFIIKNISHSSQHDWKEGWTGKGGKSTGDGGNHSSGNCPGHVK